jgi:hypothetical protein
MTGKDFAGFDSIHLECDARAPAGSVAERLSSLAGRNLFRAAGGVLDCEEGAELRLDIAMGAIEFSRVDGPPGPRSAKTSVKAVVRLRLSVFSCQILSYRVNEWTTRAPLMELNFSFCRLCLKAV